MLGSEMASLGFTVQKARRNRSTWNLVTFRKIMINAGSLYETVFVVRWQDICRRQFI
jgi:hypothetical protein